MAARGALIAYATGARLGRRRRPARHNSVFTRHLAEEMLTEGVEVEQMFKNVRVKVMRDTEQRQVPWVNTSMTNNFSFNPVLANGREEEARRADLARLQALLDQREKSKSSSNRNSSRWPSGWPRRSSKPQSRQVRRLPQRRVPLPMRAA